MFPKGITMLQGYFVDTFFFIFTLCIYLCSNQLIQIKLQPMSATSSYNPPPNFEIISCFHGLFCFLRFSYNVMQAINA